MNKRTGALIVAAGGRPEENKFRPLEQVGDSTGDPADHYYHEAGWNRTDCRSNGGIREMSWKNMWRNFR